MAERLADRLSAWERPVITSYELSTIVCAECRTLGVEVELSLYRKVILRLETFRLLNPRKDSKPSTAFQLFGHSSPLPMEVACAMDPFANVSHLSAMEFHGITDRFSKLLYLTTPPDKEWKEQARDKMAKDLGEQLEAHRLAKLPALRRVPFERVDDVRIELMRRSSRGAFKAIKSPAARVSMLGRTFLDMLREPEHCGGMQHVVDTYREHGARYLPLIVEEVDRHGKAIEKVRAGYLLDEVCRLHHPLIDGWKHAAQRGGSRVLDPKSEYAAFYSETWQLSVNVPSLFPEGLADGALS